MTTDEQPADIPAEKALLGAILIDPAAVDDVAGVVGVDDFTRPAGQAIYAAVLRLRDRGIPPDYVALCGELEDAGLLARIGVANVTALINECPTSLHALTYARRVSAKARERRGEPDAMPAQEPKGPSLHERLGISLAEADAW